MRPLGLFVTLSAVLAAPSPPHAQGPVSGCPVFDFTPIPPPSARCGRSCGRDRWPVKTLSDPDRHRIRAEPVFTMVESLAALPRPPHRPHDRRVAPTETTIFCVEGMIYDIPRTQADRDWHIVVAGLEDSTVSLIAEIPDPRCDRVCSSGFAHLFARARERLEARLRIWTTDTLRVRLAGVGFFDRNHGQYGPAPNFIELHPVLAIEFP
jgi:hypothetical protein